MHTVEARGGRYHIVNGEGVSVKDYGHKHTATSKLEAFNTVADPTEQLLTSPAARYPINKRFEFTSALVQMVVDGITPSAIVTGDGGLGKSHTVLESLYASDMEDISLLEMEEGDEIECKNADGSFRYYNIVKGFSTAKGLYEMLYDNRHNLIIFDDCDSIQKDANAINLLKGALDSYDKRTISWQKSAGFGDDYPRTFQFEGGVIFISNMTQERLDQALRTRAMCVDLSMTVAQKIDRIEFVSKERKFLPDYTAEVKAESVELIREHMTDANELSIRSLINVCKIAKNGNADWKDLATYMLTN